MTTLAVWRFDAPIAGDACAEVLEDLRLRAYDAAVVSWVPGRRRPHTRMLPPGVAPGSLDPGFWGLLFGLVFFAPLLGAAIGATTGAIAGSLADVGIDDHFMNRVRDQVTPGTSALFLLAPDAAVDALRNALGVGAVDEPIVTHLEPDQDAALREVFGS